METILKYLKPHGKKMMLGLTVKITGTFMDLGLPWVLAYIIDDVIPHEKISLIALWGGVMLLLSVGARQFNMKANQMASKVAADTTRALRHDLYWKIEQLSGKQVDELSIPSLVSRMTTDTYNVHQTVGMMQRLGVRAPIILIGGIIITSTLEPVLTLILVAILPMLGLIVYYVYKKGIPIYMEGQTAMDSMIRTVRENISGIRVIKALSKTDYENARFRKDVQEVVKKETKAGTIMATINPAMNLLLNIGLTLVVVAGAYRVNSGASEVGKIVAFLSYFTMILTATLMLTRIFVNLSKASASSIRIGKVLNAEEDLIAYSEEKYPNSPNKGTYFIEFDHVTFGYNEGEESEKNCMKDISFRLKKGESLGIIGSTGSGKSTIINLLMRYYDIQSGAIYVEGKDIRTYHLEELRKKFGVVFQNDSIFKGTVKTNIDLYRELPDERIKQASLHAQAGEFIDKLGLKDEEEILSKASLSMEEDESSILPNIKYNYGIATGGTNISGGQKQRLLLSRALSDKPEILILDDSSSALDYKTDANLRKEIDLHYENSTTIMIAQRISSIMNMDYILVLEDGEIIGYGTHDELLQTCDVYKEIYQSQMGNA